MSLRASLPLAIGDDSPQRFVIGPRGGVLSLRLVFYSDMGGTIPVAGGTGSRLATVRRLDRVRLDDADRDTEVSGGVPENTFEVSDDGWQSITVGDSYSAVEVSAVELATPGTAVVYRIIAADTIVRGHEDAPERVVNQPGTVLDVLQTLNWNIDVLPGHGIHPAFGVRSVPNNSQADVWAGVATTRPLPLAPKPMFIVSNSAADTFGNVAGAQLSIVSFIDENGDWRNSDLLVMNGINNVPITYKPSDGVLGMTDKPPAPPSPPGAGSQIANIFRVQDATVVVAAGATEALPKVNNIGDIRVVDGAARVFEVIPIGAGRSRSAAFHCPRGFTARLTYAPVATANGRGTAYIAANFGLGTAWNLLPVAAVDGTTALFAPDPATTPVAERADVQAVIITDQNAIVVSFDMQFRLIPIAA